MVALSWVQNVLFVDLKLHCIHSVLFPLMISSQYLGRTSIGSFSVEAVADKQDLLPVERSVAKP